MIRSLLLAVGIGLGATAAGSGDDARLSPGAFADPRTHAIMRHALAPGYSDPSGFDVEDCATQRNLNAAGREQARATGEVMRASGNAVDAVWTSQWCRCVDTAALLDLGDPLEVPALNSFFEDRSTRTAQTEALRTKLRNLAPDIRVMMLTHQVNISALLGRSTTSGEVVIFTMNADGTVEEKDSFVVPVR